MRLHPNAKTTPAGRWLLVQRIEDDRWTVAETAEACGVSERTAHKWLSRFRKEDLSGLAGDRNYKGPSRRVR